MSDQNEASAPQVAQPGHNKPTEYQQRAQWEPIYTNFVFTDFSGGDSALDYKQNRGGEMALPIGWRCPCGAGVFTENGHISCPKCGRIPRDNSVGKLDRSQRCTTGRQGRKWKAIGRR